MCWRSIVDALPEYEDGKTDLLPRLEEIGGNLWPRCQVFFVDLVERIFPPNFNLDRSIRLVVKELLANTHMKYDDVRYNTAL
jgi:hypothetical protein